MTDELPPIEFLDAAAKATNWIDWVSCSTIHGETTLVREAIVAHARTLQRLAKYEPRPVDPAELQRRQDAREAGAQYWDTLDGCEVFASACRSGRDDGDSYIRPAYIALCHRDNTTPIPVEQWGEGK